MATPTLEATATLEVTATSEATPTEAAAAYSSRITAITLLNDGTYAVDFVTSGFTADTSSTHVHFFFDWVSEANAGIPGSGPWKLYGGPSPFTQYGETHPDRQGSTNMCILVANPDHSIISGTGNCYPLP